MKNKHVGERGHTAGKVRKGYAAVGAMAFLAAFLYVFWRVGKYWPGVPQPVDGIFRLNQVLSSTAAGEHDLVWL